MRDWSLSSGDPLYLSLAADARLCKPDYVNDHIWEVEFGAADPERSAVLLNTTFGLRARSMRIFLRFTENNTSVTDPNTFAGKPSLRRYYPNFLTLDFVPLEALNVTAEFWVPESHAVAGRVMLTNKSNAIRQIKLEVCAALAPLDGQSIIPTQQQLVNILAGQTGGIAPVIFMIQEENKALKVAQAGSQELGKERDKLSSELSELQQTAASAIQLKQQRDQLGEQVVAIERELQQLRRENQALTDSSNQDWFLYGGGLSLFGVLLGFILPKISWRRRSSGWDSF